MILGPYRALSLGFTVACSHEPAAAVMRSVFAGLVDDGSLPVTATVALAAERNHHGVWTVLVDGREVASGLGDAAVVPHVQLEVNSHLIDASAPVATLLHAGGLARHGAVVALPAKSMSGKSTLTTWLAAHGWDYVTDETVAVVPGTLAVLPYRKPVAVRHGSRTVLAPVLPPITDATVDFFDWEQFVLPASSGTATPGVLRAVAFPRFGADVEGASLVPVPPAEVLVRLAHNCHEFERVGVTSFRRLEAIARAVPAVDLVYGSLPAATEQLAWFLDAVAGPPADVTASVVEEVCSA